MMTFPPSLAFFSLLFSHLHRFFQLPSAVERPNIEAHFHGVPVVEDAHVGPGAIDVLADEVEQTLHIEAGIHRWAGECSR